jgi:exonuclease III
MAETALLIGVVNPHGGMTPPSPRATTEQPNRLHAAACIVASGVLDVLALPEAHNDAHASSHIRAYLRGHFGSAVTALFAPASPQAASIELSTTEDLIKSRSHSGVVVLLSAKAARGLHNNTPPVVYEAGRMIHLTLHFLAGRLHIIGMYGVSAPTTARKEWLATSLHRQLNAVLTTDVGTEACVVLLDENAVSLAFDRQSNRLTSYDEAEHALWRALHDHGFLDSFRLRYPDTRAYTYLHNGRPCSRLDKIYLNMAAMSWAQTADPLRVACTTSAPPLSTDHCACLASLAGPFIASAEDCHERMAGERGSTRLTLNEQAQLRYMIECDDPQYGLAAVADDIHTHATPWIRTAVALDTLELPPEFSALELQHAYDTSTRSCTDREHALSVLRTHLGNDERADLTPMAAKAHGAVASFMRDTPPN